MKFIIATGGTGGHLFPALRVAEELKREGHDIVFLGSFRRSQEKMRDSGFRFEDLTSKGLVTNSLGGMFSSVAAMIKATYKAFWLLKKIKPNVVIGFGGYGAFPAMFSAVLLRRPTLIHEQNVVPGRANALLAGLVSKIAVSFKKSVTYFSPKKTVLTGCPCHLPPEHLNRAAVLEKFRLKEGKVTILIFGGSQGSRQINEAFLESAAILSTKIDFQVIHISGGQDDQKIESMYNQLGIPFALFGFLDKMEEAYSVANLVVSRAGAVTVSEIAHFQLPSVLIPYPHAQGHQKENALVLCEIGVSELIEERNISAEKLAESALRVVSHEGKNGTFESVCLPGATERLAQEVLKLTR